MKNNNKKTNKNLKIQFKCNFKNKIYLKNTKKKKKQKMSLKRRTAKRDQPEIEEIKKGFEMFDIDNTGKISPFELKETMDAMNMKDKNPVIYSLISSLCTDEYKEGIRRIFDIFTEPNSETISLSNFVQAAKELREDVTEKELKDLLEKAKASGNELTFEEFYNIMINGIDVENMKNERVDTHSSKYSNKNENSIKNESSVRSRRSRKDDDEDNSKKEEKEETNSKRSYRSNRRSDNGEKIVTEEVTETKYSYRNRREKKEEEKSEEQPTSETGSRRRRRLGQ